MNFFSYFAFSLCMFLPLFSLPNSGAKYRPLILIDPGHGGAEKGARTHHPYFEEKRLTLIASHFTKEFLEKMGYRVKLTRTRDRSLPLETRVGIAHRLRAGLFISIHFNTCPNPQAHGVEIFYAKNQSNFKRTQASRRLAKTLLKNLTDHTKQLPRGAKVANFYVLRETKMPAVLVEGGFLTNPEEKKNIVKTEYLQLLARGIAEGIDRFTRQ